MYECYPDSMNFTAVFDKQLELTKQKPCIYKILNFIMLLINNL